MTFVPSRSRVNMGPLLAAALLAAVLARPPAALADVGQGPYPLDEAIDDALAAPLIFVGKGKWHGIDRSQSCAYKNDRVLVVDVYCAGGDPKSFRVDIFSPDRGRVKLYAEASAPIHQLERADYFTFTCESEPPPGRKLGTPMSLGMSFAALSKYNKIRSGPSFPACWGGTQLGRRSTGCTKPLDRFAREFAARNDPFLDAPTGAWYELVRLLVDQRGTRK